MTCTTEGCAAETEVYLCAGCVRDFQAWLDKARELLPDLDVTIHRQDVVRTHSEGGGGGKSGSAAPLNLDALQLKTNLASIDRDASEYAKDPFAAGMAGLVREWVEKAELLISGPEPERVDHAANRERVKEIAPPMPTRELLPWLKENAKITLTSQHVRDWVRRGHLRPVQREPQPTYHPHEVIAAWHRKDAS